MSIRVSAIMTVLYPILSIILPTAGARSEQASADIANNRLITLDISDSQEEVRATINTGISVNHFISIIIALFGGLIWQ